MASVTKSVRDEFSNGSEASSQLTSNDCFRSRHLLSHCDQPPVSPHTLPATLAGTIGPSCAASGDHKLCRRSTPGVSFGKERHTPHGWLRGGHQNSALEGGVLPGAGTSNFSTATPAEA